MEICYRCDTELTESTLSNVEGISFYQCPSCKSQYTKEPNKKLHDRWQMPITVPLYQAIYAEDPFEVVESAVNEVKKQGTEFESLLIKHIESELLHPKQNLCDIFDFSRLKEGQLRIFLKFVKDELLKD